MKDNKKTATGVNALSKLVSGSGAPPANEDADDAKLEADVGKMLELVESLAGEDVFDMQILIEACAEELREQIRDLIEADR